MTGQPFCFIGQNRYIWKILYNIGEYDLNITKKYQLQRNPVRHLH